MNDTADIGQPDAGSVEFIGSMESLKDAEEFVGVAHIESYTVVPDEHYCFVLTGLLTADLDGGLGSCPGKLNGIADQIGKDLSQHGRISGDLRQLSDCP